MPWQRESKQEDTRSTEKNGSAVSSPTTTKAAKKFLIWMRGLRTIEHRVADAELVLQAKREALEDQQLSRCAKAAAGSCELDAAQEVVDMFVCALGGAGRQAEVDRVRLDGLVVTLRLA